MNLDQIATKCFILALFIRDDGQRLLLGDGYYDFNQKLQHFQANTIANDIVEIQGDSGQLLAGQVMRSGTQKFEGYIGDATTNRQTIEQKRSDFMAFFRIKHFYKVIYIFPDGTAIQRQRGYLTDAPTIPEIFQRFPEYSVALNFEDANYYEYAEDAEGNEIYAHIAELALSGNTTGGLIWDEIGAVSNGISWSGIQTAQGEYIQITNDLSLEAPLASVEMLGKAEQAGTPTPTSPQPISVVTGENVVKIEGSDSSQEFEVNLGKNLFDKDNASRIYAYIQSNTNWRYYNDSYSFRIPCQPNTTYTLSANNPSETIFRAGVTDSDTIPSSGVDVAIYSTTRYSNTNVPIYLTTGANAKYIVVQIAEETASDTLATLQLEKGSQATSFAPYFTPIELAKIGSYQDRIFKADSKWYIEKKVGKVVLNGTQNIGTTTYASLYFVYTSQFSGMQYQAGAGLSDYFVYNTNSMTDNTQANNTLQDNQMALRGGTSTDRLYIKASQFADATAFKTWLSSNPTTVYYALATPTTTEITNEALIAQLEALGASSLYVGVNNIGTETLNAMPTLKIEYYTEVDLDGAGYEWEPGGNTAKTIVTVAGVDSAWPIWTVQGGAQNPTLTNITTGQTISWQGFVPEGQTLTINMAEMTADLAGANVFEYITGEWIRLAPGNNTLAYNAGNADKPSTLSWNGVLA